MAGEMAGARLVGLALAMSHSQLGVDQGCAGRHLEGASPAFALLQGESNLAAKLLLEEGRQSVRKLLVASATSEVDSHGKGRH